MPAPDRPLDPVGSIKTKIGLLVGLSVLAAVLVLQTGQRAGVPAWLTVPATLAAALGVTAWLARGMTAPLRQMTAAAGQMAAGDYSVRVATGSADEVGRLARAFNTMAADIATADAQRRQLVATVSHELRTPLAAQRALLENLVDGVRTPDAATLAAALAQAERLSDLVEDLLDLARVDGGAAVLDLGPVRVADLLSAAVAEARVGGRDVALRTVVEPPNLTVRADGARLAQVAANLLDNAARHSPAGGTITVRAAGEDGWWSLEVCDEGPGIPPGQEQAVFTRFGTADPAGGGTGLGLSIAAWVCELHGGSIAAVPSASGARIRAVLPRDPEATGPVRPGSVDPALAGPAPAPAPAGSDGSASPAPHPVWYLKRFPGPAKALQVPHRMNPAAGLGRPVAPEDGPGTTAPTPAPALPARPGAVGALTTELWPERGLTTAPRPLLASLAIGALAAVVLPDREVGLGALLVLLLSGALVLMTARYRTRPWTHLSAYLSLALGALLVLRAAGWLAVLALLVVAVLVTTALTGAHRLPAMLAGAAAWPLSALRGLPLLGRTLTAMSSRTLLWPVLRTAAVSLVALVVFGGLFASGDAIFGSWVAHLVPDLAWDGLILRTFVLVVVAGTVLAACYLALNPPRVDRLALPAARPVARAWEWLVPVGLVLAVFVGFVAAQASAMWGGHDYVRRVTGLSYADYVHQGFGQLTVATALTLATVAIAVRRAPRATARDRLLLRAALGPLCALTLVVVASALFRMAVYQQAYGYTVLRVLVDAFELWLGLVVVLVLVAGVRWSAAWLPRAALVSGAVFLLALGLANPEGWVARQNIERYADTGKIDTSYLATLGPDAVPAIVEGLPADLARCALPDPADGGWGRAGDGDVLEWNLGRSQAAAAVGALPGAGTSTDRSRCP
ncbi:DUF4173 domain-containing protein [Georgenia sp. TF02-10]|uniref:DUF4153 domain-containing protein n=1 Tax=Georgenia sp. TF02-10 TaxID=2917725 RepID=UPI001FA75BA0|nr:DUF4153 domain-containing protein [Georgenia sp. TF02-10]UNX53512.1 DUF4173 domain-containing protein [Georgenia sp. TF02-10]